MNICLHTKLYISIYDVKPVDNQGSSRFNLISHQRSAHQFRLQPFKTDVLQLTHQIYGGLVPKVMFCSDCPLPVYTSKVNSGKTTSSLTLQRIRSHFKDNQEPSMNCLAVFRATWRPQSNQSYAMDGWTAASKASGERLIRRLSHQKLAPQLVSIIYKLHSDLPLLVTLLHVLTHHGLVSGGSPKNFWISSMRANGYFLTKMPSVTLNNSAASPRGCFLRDDMVLCFPHVCQTDELKEAVEVATRVGVIHSCSVRRLLDNLRESDQVHRYIFTITHSWNLACHPEDYVRISITFELTVYVRFESIRRLTLDC